MTAGLVLGIDGGNTKSIAVLAGSDGSVLATASAGCGDIYGASSEEEALGELGVAVMTVLQKARRSPGDVAVTVASLAGADWPEDHDLYRAYLTECAGLTGDVVILNDGLGPLPLGDPTGAGVSLVIGTGCAIGARGPTGESWHGSFWLRDLGGGGIRNLADRALRAVCRSVLGLAEDTVLTGKLLETYGLGNAEELLHHLTGRPSGHDADWAPCVGAALLEAAAAGDALAASVVRDYADQVADYVSVAARHVGLDTRPFTVVMTGGLLQGRVSPLAALISSAIQRQAPQARPQTSPAQPVAGAVLEALAILNETASGPSRRRVMRSLPVNLADSAPRALAGEASVLTGTSFVPAGSEG